MFPSPGPGSVICAFGELIHDLVVNVNGPLDLDADGDVRLCSMSFHRGGVAANVAAAAASLGAPARFLGHFGADPISTALAEEVQRSGVRIFGCRRGKGAYSLCVTDETGNTRILTDLGDGATISPSEVRAWWLQDAAMLQLSGNNLYNPGSRDALWRLVELAKRSQIPISFDVAATNRLREFGVDEFRAVIKEMAPAVLLMNEDEGRMLGVDEQYPEGASVVIRHFGPEPTQVRTVSGDEWEVPVPHVPQEEVVDTVGAGDVFAGGFLVGWLQGRSLRGAIELGHELAVESIRGPGAQFLAERPVIIPVAG